uniref:DM2 domain-containing protein n=1 Tax=viral metagenome TaxID=1070528 RepID=A0A6C0DBN6_9ZZZZ
MARTTKTTKTADAASAPAPVVDNTASATPAVKATKAKKPKETKAPVETSAPVSTPAVETTPAVEGDSLESSLLEQSTEFNAKLQQLASVIATLKSEYKSLEKKWQRELKSANKQNSKRKRKSGNRQPSGFVKPTRISDELAAFLGKEKGTEMARTAVTRDINAYIRTNKLQDDKNGRKINPDTKLAALLKLQKDDTLTYFNLQRFMSPHFAKSVKAETASA